MNEAGGNAIRLLNNLQPASKNLQIKARGKVRSSWNQDCGARTHISGSSSRHPKFFAPAPERFGPKLQTKNHCIICTIGLLHKICLLDGNSNFRLRFHHSKFLGSGSTALVGTNCFWKWITLFLQMQLPSFCLFVFFVLTKVPLYFISIEIFSNENNVFANTKIISGGRFSSKVPVGGRLNNKDWRPLI